MISTRNRKLARERRTIAKMISIYCRGRHTAVEGQHSTFGGADAADGQHTMESVLHGADGDLCASCGELLAYAQKRIEKCPYEEEKPACAECPIHCYQPERRDQVRAVMRYAGPRMTVKHPFLALMHMINGLRKIPDVPKRLARKMRGSDGRGGAAAD